MKNQELKENDKLYKNVDFQINRIKKKKNTYVITFRISQILVFILGAMVTILAGWGFDDQNSNSKNYVLILSSSLTVLVAIQGLFDLKDKAWSYDIVLFELRKLRSQMAFDSYKNAKLYMDNYDDYFKEFHRILDSQKAIIENSYKSED